MPDAAQFAQASDILVAAAIAFYTAALLANVAHSALRSNRRAPELASIGASVHGNTQDLAPEAHADAGSLRRPTRLQITSARLCVVGFVAHVLAVTTRGLAAGRAPWGNMYEFTLVAAMAAMAAYLAFQRREPVRALGAWVLAIVLLALGLAITVLYTSAGALVPVLNSYWLVIHVAAATTAGGVFTVGFVATCAYLVRSRGDRRGRKHPSALPSADTLDRVARTAHLFAFPVWTFAVIAGAIWAENSWGRYWGWDPKETWAFITWTLYAAHLHAQSTPGWRGNRAAWFAVAAYLAFLFNFFGVNLWISGLHSYAGT